jgi:glutamate carboxypeptidase
MEKYLSYLKSISDSEERYLNLLCEWIAINSRSGNLPGLMEMYEALESAFRPLGGQIRSNGGSMRKDEGQENPGALHMVKRPEAAMQVLLCGHMDTVLEPVRGAQGSEPDTSGRLTAPGAADAKGGLVVMLAALECLESSPFTERLGWEVLIVPDEETGSRGSRPLLDQVAGRCHLGLVFEPALPDGSFVGERMGSGAFRITVHGQTAHAGHYPENGHSAIEALADTIVALRTLREGREGVRVNVGEIRGGGPVNIVPDKAICRIGVRVAGQEEMAYALEGLQRIVEETDQQEGFSAELRGRIGRPPKVLDNATLHLLEHAVACGRQLGLSLEWKASGGVSDGNTLAAAGLPNVDNFGPVGEGFHTPDENIVLATVAERARLTALFLMKLSSGEIPWPPP